MSDFALSLRSVKFSRKRCRIYTISIIRIFMDELQIIIRVGVSHLQLANLSDIF